MFDNNDKLLFQKNDEAYGVSGHDVVVNNELGIRCYNANVIEILKTNLIWLSIILHICMRLVMLISYYQLLHLQLPTVVDNTYFLSLRKIYL